MILRRVSNLWCESNYHDFMLLLLLKPIASIAQGLMIKMWIRIRLFKYIYIMYENLDYPAGCIFFTGFKLYLNWWNTLLYIYIIINIFSAIT